MSVGDKLRDMLVQGKDLGTAAVLEHAIEKPIAPYGQISGVSIDSRERKIKFELLLKGEAQPITLNVDEYELVEDRDQSFLVVRKATVSKEWLNALAQEFLIGRKFPLPQKYARIIKMVL